MTFHSQLNIISILLGIIFVQPLSGVYHINDDSIEINSQDSLFSNLIKIEEQNLTIRKSLLDGIGDDTTNYDVEILIHLYDINKRSNALLNQILTQTLGNMGDKKAIPILMEIALNNNLSVGVRSSSVEILSKKRFKYTPPQQACRSNY